MQNDASPPDPLESDKTIVVMAVDGSVQQSSRLIVSIRNYCIRYGNYNQICGITI